MRFYSNNQRLKDTQTALSAIPLRFGTNKKQELVRLIYEASKINGTGPRILLGQALRGRSPKDAKQTFVYLKDYFLKQRFPNAYQNSGTNFYLPKISFDPSNEALKNNLAKFCPEIIFVEDGARGYSLTKSIIRKFPSARLISIRSLKNYVNSNKDKTQIKDYNYRTRNLFLIKENSDFIKPCPCSKEVVSCGYQILNLGFGCMYECSYCFLQSYVNIKGIIIPVNIDDFLSRSYSFLKKNSRHLRIGTGEFADSLALDELTQFSQILVDFFSKTDNATLELKTKSKNIKNILRVKHNKKTVISWSLNPQPVIDSDEWRTSSLRERLEAAKMCCDAGYPVGFHFDPIIYSANWQSLYKELIAELFKKVHYKNIAWISLGTFRFTPRLKTIVEQRFPRSKILDEELVIGFDKKLRYIQKQRLGIYSQMVSWIKRNSSSVLVYLCMEPIDMWKKVLARSKY